MRRSSSAWIALALGFALAALACGPKGATPEDKRDFIRQMRSETLTKLYKLRPSARANLQSSVGYAVFSNVESKVILVGAGSGYGVLVDKATGKETFMRMARIHGGVGWGLVDFRAVFVFHDRAKMRKFAEEGLEFGGGADAAAKMGEKGAAASADLALDTTVAPLQIYQFTESGVALAATIAGTKYWKDSKLN